MNQPDLKVVINTPEAQNPALVKDGAPESDFLGVRCRHSPGTYWLGQVLTYSLCLSVLTYRVRIIIVPVACCEDSKRETLSAL